MSSYDQLDYAALYRSVNRDKPAEDPAKARGFMRGAADLGLEAASGVTRGVGMLANVFGANNPVSQGARSADEFIRAYLSAQSKQDSASAAAILAEAEDAGIGDQVAAGLRAFAQNPVSTTVNALGQAVPVIAGALIPGMGPATVAGRVGMAGIGAAQGAGSVKGAIFEGVKSEQMRQPGMTEADATAAAEQAQAYGGQNTGNILGGAALGGVAGSTGFQPAAARLLAGRGMLSQATEQVEQSMLRRLGADKLSDVAETRAGGALTGALVEGGTEFSQGGQEQYATNVALQREGFDVPTFRGVVSQGVMEAAAGSALGAGFGALDKPKSTRPTIKDIADAPTVDAAIDAFTKVLALPAPATKAQWEVVDGQQLLTGPGQPPAPPPAAPRLPAPTEPPAMMVDQFGNVTTQPASQRAEAISRDNMARADAEQAAAAQRQRTQQLGKQTPRGEGPAERIPTGDATSVDYIPSGDATEFEFVPTGDATEVQAELIEPQDLTTQDGMPYGTKSGANMRARKEGLGPANVLQVAGGWIVRPQPTALSPAGQEVQPNNTRGTRAGDVLKAPDVNQPIVDRATGLAAGAADGPGADAGRSGGNLRPDAVADGRVAGPAATPTPGSGTPVPVGSGARSDVALIPAEGTPLTLDGKPYTVAAAGKRYVTIADASGKERVISDGSHLWSKVQKALGSSGNVTRQDAANAPVPQQAAEAPRAEAPAPAATAGAAGQAAADTGAASGGAVEAGGVTVKLYRGVKPGADPRSTADTTGGALFMSPDEKVARQYANGGAVDAREVTFKNLLDVPRWTDAKRALGLPASATMPELIEAARTRGHDGMAFTTTNGKEYIQIAEAPVQPQAQAGSPAEGAGGSRPTLADPKPTVYKTRLGAERAKAGNTQRIRKTKDGFILREATDKELAAAEKAGRRLASSGVDVEKDSLLVAIAKLGGLNISERSDTIGEGNRNIGGKMLFTRTGKPLDTMADEALREYGYVPQQEVNRDGGVRWLRDAIKAEFNGGREHYSEQGMDAIMQREQAQQEAEFLASREAEDVFGDLDADEVQASGYTAASPEIQAMTERLVAEAEALGVDVESIRERVSMASDGKTQDEYEFAVQQAIIEAIEGTRSDAARRDTSPTAGSSEDRGQVADRQGQEEGLTLEAQDAEGLRTRADREARAAAEDAREQRRLADKAKADAERDEFTLTGSDRAVDVGAAAGQGGLFDASVPTPQAAADAPAEPDYLAELFGTPAQQAEAQARFTANAAAKKRGLARVRDAIAEQQQRAKTEYDEWAGKVYKRNSTQVDLPGDGPSSQASMSIGAINESRRRNAMEALTQEMRALDRLADEVATDSGAERVQASLSSLYERAGKIAADGNGLFKTADEQFQYMLLDDLKMRGPGGKGNVTSNGLSKAMLAAVKPESQAAADKPAAEVQATIQDVGEKIGGARKDTAVSTGTTRRKSDDDRPAWARRFQVSEIVTPGGMLGEVKDAGRWIIRDTKSLEWNGQAKQVGRTTFSTKEEADAFVPIAAVGLKHRPVPTSGGKYEIWRDITDRKRVKVVEQQFDTRDEAMAYMVQNAVAIVETNTTFGEADLPLPPDRKRAGPARRDGDVRGEDFKESFGLRGVEFGNWNNQDERQALMNDAWDGLMDLADVMGIPPKAIGLNGDLALAFGARGHGLNSARAHYELDRAVINLTKERGAGSLAHEWFHALDHYFGRQDGKASAAWVVNKDGTRSLKTGRDATDDLASGGFTRNRSGVRPEVRAAYEKLLTTMTKRAETYVEDMAKVDKFTGATREELASSLDSLRRDLSEQKDVRYWKRNNKPASAELLAEFDLIAKAMIDGDMAALATDWRLIKGDKAKTASRWTNDTLERLSAIYKEVRGRSGFDGTNQNGLMDRLRGNMNRYSQRLKMLADAQAGAEKQRMVPTEFAREARELDQGRGGDYWTTPHEMAARAFQGYVEDKIATQGGTSRFLNYGPENAGILTPWGFKRPYPTGAERIAINKALDEFVGELKTRTDDAGNVALYSRTGAAPDEAAALQALSENDDLFALPKSEATTLREIGLDIAPQIVVSKAPTMAGTSETWNITMPTGEVGKLYVRKPNPFGPTVYGFDLNEGEITGAYEGRPGTNPDDVDPDTEDVYIDVSKLQPGQGGNQVYAIAAAYAHSTGRIFIGDPAGLSDDAMRRRSENMLSSALRYGTTRHLAPHPRQEAGANSIGVPPLQWTYGDDLGNIRRLIDVNVKALENAFPAAKKIDFDADTGQFRNADTGAVIERSAIERAARERRRGLDERLAGAGVARVAGVQSALRGASAGGSTIARGAVWRALSREEGTGSQGSGRRNGLLVRLAQLGAQSVPGLNRLFSRPAAGATTAADLRTALEAEFTPETIGALERAGLLTIADRPGRGMPADAAGVTRRDGSMELFAANTAQSSTAVAYHEALHATLRSTIGEDTFKALMDRLAKIDRAASNSSGEVNRFFREAAGRIPEDVTGEARTEELAAYSVEVYQSNRERMPSTLRRWVEDLMAALRAGLAKALQVAGVGVRVRARLLADPATLQRLARDGLQFMARQGMGDNAAMAFSRAYHGTPYRGIERFDTSKIGTGEGAQSFGWGLYFASKKEIAEHYRKTLGGAEFDYADEATRERMRRLTNFDDWLWKHIGDTAHDADFDPAKTATALRAYAARYSGSRDAVREIAGLVEDGKLIPKPGGQLYEVEVPEDSELLHWERPLSKQPDAVREALAPFLERYQASQRKIMSAFPEAEVEREIQASQKTITGQEIYEQAGYMEGGGDRSASEYLRGLGIRGIKYLDATSRDGSGGSSNYVIFSGDDVQIQGAMYSRAAAATASAANPNASPGTGWAMPEGTKFDDFVYKYQDKNVDLKRAIAGITKDRQALEDNIDAYLQEELFHERAAKRTQDFTKDELGPIMKDMAQRGITLEALDEYLHNRHAEEANKVAAERNKDDQGNSTMPDGGSGIKTADARAYLAGLDPSKRKRLEAAAAKIDAIIAKTRQTLVDYGLESQTVVDGWGAQFDHYVPLMREDEGGGMGTGQGFSVKGKESKSRTGSTDRKVVDILANIAMQRERAIVRGEKNRVAVAMVGLVDANPAPDFWQADYIPTERVFNERTGLVEERQILGFKNRPNVLVAKVAGPNGEVQERAIVFNERNPRAVRMAESLKNLDAAQLEGLLGVSAKITRYFAAINTQYNPIFGFVNFIRDVQGAIINLQSTALKGSEKDVMKGVVPALAGVYADTRKARQGKAATSPWSALWEEFQNEGGATGFRDLFRTSADRANAIKREIDPTAWMNSPLGKVFTANGNLKVPLAQAQKGATWLFDWLSDYNLAMENAVRLSAYKVALDGGMTKQRAASLAKNLTVNFNRKGQAGMQAGAVYAFFNAAMQGTARMGDVMFEGEGAGMRLSGLGRKIIYGGMALGAMQAMALAAAGFDDDEPPPFVRERSLIIPIGALAGGKEYISIPMPLGWHVIPGVGREATEFVLSGFKDPGKRAASLVALFADAFNPIGNAGMSLQTITPTALDPLVALAENRDWTGKPIARESLDRTTPGFALAKDTASAPAKWLAETINLMSGGTDYTRGALSPTPDQIDYLWGQVTGGVGRELSKVEQTATAALTGESLPTYKIPLVGRFVGDADGPTSQGGRFYENLNQINLHEAQIKGLVKDGRAAEAQQYRAENPEASLISVANMAERQVRRLRARKRELLAKDAPREAITAIEEQITQAMTRFNEAVQRREAAPV